MNDKQFENAYRSAGAWFVALYMETVDLIIDDLNNNKDYKINFIKEVYDNGEGPDKYESGTRTRVNCLMRIVNCNRKLEALNKVINSSRLQRQFPEAVEKAEELYKIYSS